MTGEAATLCSGIDEQPAWVLTNNETSRSAKATATETTREFVRKFLHDASPSSHMQE